MTEPASLRAGVLDPAVAAAAASLWGAASDTLEHVSTGASFTYRFMAGERQLYLRLTPPGWQDEAGLRGEIAYIETLKAAGIAVVAPVPSVRDELVEPIEGPATGVLLAMAFEAAPGRHVAVREWDAARTRRFGRLLAEVHAAAPQSLPDGARRHSFEAEIALTRRWMPQAETDLQAYLDGVQAWAATLPRAPDSFGLVHYDLCEDNVLWDGAEPTVIDFDDCTFSWFAADMARTLGSLYAADPGRYVGLQRWFTQGYREVRPFDGVTAEYLDAFVRLNAICDVAWCLHAREGGLAIGDTSPEGEQHLREVIAAPEAWTPSLGP